MRSPLATISFLSPLLPAATVTLVVSALSGGPVGPPQSTRAEVVLQPGHTLAANEYAVTRDGELMVTAGGNLDRTARLWDLATGYQLRAFSSSAPVNHVAISPDGRRIAVPTSTTEVAIYVVEDGSVFRRVPLPEASVSTMAFSPDGLTLAVGSTGALEEKRWLRLIDLDTGQQLELTRRQPVWRLAFAPDGRLFWIEGSMLRVGEAPWATARVLAKFGGMASDLSLSGDGRLVAVAYYTGRGSETEVTIWNARSGEAVRTFDTPRSDRLVVSFNPDGTQLATAGHLSNVIVYSAPDWAAGPEISGRRPVFLSAGHLAVSSSKGITLLDPGGGPSVILAERTGASVKAARFSGDGRYMVAGSDTAVVLWDLQSGQPVQFWREQYRLAVDALATSADGSWAIVPGVGPELRAVALPSGDVRFTVDASVKDDRLSHAGPVVLSRDDRWLVDAVARYSPGVREFGLRITDAATGRMVRMLRGPAALVDTIALSADGQFVACIDGNGGVWVWERKTGRRVLPRREERSGSAVAFVKGQLVVASLNDIHVYDTRGGLTRTIEGHPAFIHRLAVSPDERVLAFADDQQAIVLVDTETWTRLGTLTGHQGTIEDLSFSPDGALLLTASYDGTARLWDVRPTSARQVLILATSRASSDWVAVTPDGLFDGSPGGWDLILWRFSGRTRDVTPVEAFFGDYYHPGLLAEAVRGQTPPAPADISTRDRRLPVTTVNVISSNGATARVRVTAKEAAGAPGGGLRDVRLLRNGIAVKAWRGAQPATSTFEADVPLVDGDNLLTAYAFNDDNVKSRNGSATVKGTRQEPGRVFVIAAGVDEYADSALNLKNAVADARAFGETVGRDMAQATGKTPVVALLTDGQASEANMRTALGLLAGAVAPGQTVPEGLRALSRATPADVVVFFFAGHAVARADLFHLLPHDVVAADLRPSLSSDDLHNLIEGIDAGAILLIIDSCQSGQLLESADARQGPLNTRGLAQLAYDKGMYILAASQSYQAALEVSELGHGLLTYALVVDGLDKFKADVDPRDRRITVREWLQHAVRQVPQLAGHGAARLLKITTGQPGGPQIPRVFLRRDLGGDTLLVKRRDAANAH